MLIKKWKIKQFWKTALYSLLKSQKMNQECLHSDLAPWCPSRWSIEGPRLSNLYFVVYQIIQYTRKLVLPTTYSKKFANNWNLTRPRYLYSNRIWEHRSLWTMEYLWIYCDILEDWPSGSYDLNPIEMVEIFFP
jgi:hypothetical protein